MTAKHCALEGCGAAKAADIHSRHSNDPKAHEYQDARTPGLKPMSEGMATFRRASGYDAAVKAAKGSPCQVVSPVCTGTAEHLHEILPRGRAGGLAAALRDGPPPVECCDPCNGYISANPVWAAEHGWLISRKGTLA